MIVGGHTVRRAEHVVSNRIITHVGYNIDVLTSHRLRYQSLAVSGSESGARVGDKKSIYPALFPVFLSFGIVPVAQILIYLSAKLSSSQILWTEHLRL